MTIQVDMAEVSRFLSCAVGTATFILLMVVLKHNIEFAKWKKEHRTALLRMYFEHSPNRCLTCKDIIDMAKEEVQEVVFVQWAHDFDDYARPNLTENGGIYFDLLGEGKSAVFKTEDYNRKFRCWLYKPTREEEQREPWG